MQNFIKKGVDKSKNGVYNARHRGKDVLKILIILQASVSIFLFMATI